MTTTESLKTVPRIAFTYKEAAASIGVSERSITEWVNTKRIPVHYLSDRLPRIAVAELEQFVMNQKDIPDGERHEAQKDRK